MNVPERINALRLLMEEKKIDAYIIPSADSHQSEYVGEHFKARAFLTGFTGSNGTAVITRDDAGLWTDGRYFIQAQKELEGTGITLYKMGNPGVPTITEYLEAVLPHGGTLGFDGRMVSMQAGKTFAGLFAHKQLHLEDRYDLVDSIWEERPPLSEAPIHLLSERFCGESTASKLGRLRQAMKEAGAAAHLVITLDDIAWLLNFRGNDVAYTPVALCYAVITMEQVHLFMNEKKVSQKIREYFAKNGVLQHPYDEVYPFVEGLEENSILLDPNRCNYALYRRIPQGTAIIEGQNPCVLLKAVKNETEIANIRNAHRKDAVACTKFLYWLKTTFQKETITECSASEKLEQLRSEQEGFLSPSFEPICAYGANAAMCHYTSSAETDCALKEGALFLFDTGGHYLEGSTDITRTVALGSVSDKMKEDYTNVLRGNLALSHAVFLQGCTGEHLDILARQFLWHSGLDYNHGTGHGVGYLLSIHEGPCRISWKPSSEGSHPLESGMIVTDEPGVYVEQSHGIRLENELLVRRGLQNEAGQFLQFEVLTYVPFDLDAMELSLLTEAEKLELNRYHKQVYEIVSPHLTEEEAMWLKDATREI